MLDGVTVQIQVIGLFAGMPGPVDVFLPVIGVAVRVALDERLRTRIEQVGGEGALRQHFLDMGVIPGAEVTMMKFAPLGDPMELRIHGYELTLRLADAEKILITPLQSTSSEASSLSSRKKKHPHPGLGEEGKFERFEKVMRIDLEDYLTSSELKKFDKYGWDGEPQDE